MREREMREREMREREMRERERDPDGWGAWGLCAQAEALAEKNGHVSRKSGAEPQCTTLRDTCKRRLEVSCAQEQGSSGPRCGPASAAPAAAGRRADVLRGGAAAAWRRGPDLGVDESLPGQDTPHLQPHGRADHPESAACEVLRQRRGHGVRQRVERRRGPSSGARPKRGMRPARQACVLCPELLAAGARCC